MEEEEKEVGERERERTNLLDQPTATMPFSLRIIILFQGPIISWRTTVFPKEYASPNYLASATLESYLFYILTTL